jgi:uncharacterized damage-inducible protein DinB
VTSFELPAAVGDSFAREYRRLVERVHDLARPLSEDAFWARPFPFGNSFGHLVLHLTGNLNYYIGAQVAATGYVRDRDREFVEPDHLPKADALKALQAAVDVVIATARAQEPDDWTRAYFGAGEPDARCRFDIFLKCAVHFYHHVGQMIYLARTQDSPARPF